MHVEDGDGVPGVFIQSPHVNSSEGQMLMDVFDALGFPGALKSKISAYARLANGSLVFAVDDLA